MEAETVHGSAATARGQQQIAQLAIGKYIKGYLDETISESHRLAYAQFRSWYRGYEAAKKLAEHSVAEAICKWVFKKALDLVFPEEAVVEGAAEEALTATAKVASKLNEIIKEKSEQALDFALEHLKPSESGNIEAFLDAVGVAEEQAITKLLNAEGDFEKANPALMSQAVDEFVFATLDPDKPWTDMNDVPPSVKGLLGAAGVGTPGEAAATRAAEGWLAGHIQGVYESSEAYRQGRPDWDEKVVAMIASLRQMDPVGNRERIYALEKRIPPFFRSIVNINTEAPIMMHIRLGIDTDVAEKIAAGAPYSKPEELVEKKILSSEEFGSIKHLVVALDE
jgi:hypothetical protein